MIFLQRYLCKS